MAKLPNPAATTEPAIETRLRQRRQSLGWSQQQLADRVGITRQAVSAVEANLYSPATSVALQLARALKCRVEELFFIKSDDEMVDGELLGPIPNDCDNLRAQLTQVGARLLVRPLDGAGELTSLTASADGLMVGFDSIHRRVKVKLLKSLETIGRQAAVGGCDPAMFLAAENLRRHREDNLVPCIMGNRAALAALARGEIHAAGVHLTDEGLDRHALARWQRSIGQLDCTVVTFAHWEEGIIVPRANPKKIRGITDLIRPKLRIINREKGSGARRLLDGELRSAGIPVSRVKGYSDEVFSHLEVASRVQAGLADAGVGVRAAARICGLGFLPLQRERYDLIIPKMHFESRPALRNLLDLMVGRPFRAELAAFGDYDTRDTGKIVAPSR